MIVEYPLRRAGAPITPVYARARRIAEGAVVEILSALERDVDSRFAIIAAQRDGPRETIGRAEITAVVRALPTLLSSALAVEEVKAAAAAALTVSTKARARALAASAHPHPEPTPDAAQLTYALAQTRCRLRRVPLDRLIAKLFPRSVAEVAMLERRTFVELVTSDNFVRGAPPPPSCVRVLRFSLYGSVVPRFEFVSTLLPAPPVS
jgi:hypothetical protein